MRLVGKLTRVDIDVREVVDLIGKDPVLCGQVLRAVNSARYARRAKVHRVEDAVNLVGIATLRKLALGCTVSSLFGQGKPSTSWSNLRFNLHSAAVAIFTEILAAHVPVANSEAAFVAGLLHDIGKFAIAINLKKEYEMILEMKSSSGRTLSECEHEIIGVDHAEISGLMLARWELPPYLHRAAFYHHRPDEAEQPKPSLSHLLNVSDQFIHHLGMSVEVCDTANLPECSLAVCGEELPREKVLAQFHDEYGELSEFFR